MRITSRQKTRGEKAHRKPGPAPQRKAALGRPYGLNHVAIGPMETGLEAQASHVASRAVRGERDLGRALTATPAASVAVPSRGEPLPASTRAWLEPAFGADLRAVRVHDNAEAATAAHAEHAHAFTAGRDIYFNEGRYDPRAEDGRHLLAHEVAHVLQQTGLSNGMRATETSGPGEVQRAVSDPAEKEQPKRKPREAKPGRLP
jgi:Domain of unknown function (DUF4157)